MPTRSLDGVGDEKIQADVLELRRPLAVAAELDEVADELRQLLDLDAGGGERGCAIVLGQAAGRQQLDVRAQTRQRRPQLVRRVRDELPLRAERPLERCQHLVEGLAEPRELVATRGLHPSRRVSGRRDALGGVDQPAHRRGRRARDEESERGRERDTGERDEHEQEPQSRQHRIHLVQRPGDLKCEPAGQRGREDAEVDAAHLRVGEELVSVPARHGALAASRGQRQVRAPWPARSRRRRTRPGRTRGRPEGCRRQGAGNYEPGQHLRQARPFVQGLVNLVAQGVAHGQIRADGSEHDRHGHSRGRREREARAKAHASRSA